MSLPELVCACANLRRATRALTQVYDDGLRPSGLRITQLSLLKALEIAGELRQGRLGEVMGIDTTTLTRTLAPLRKQGLLEIRPGKDRRERRLSLTAKGRAKVAALMPLWERAQDRVKHFLGKDYLPLQKLLHEVARMTQPG
jgi:DNA-binding MarR family transcriptional regulator